MAETNPTLIFLVEIAAPGGTRRFSTVGSYSGGVEWQARLFSEPRVLRGVLTAEAGQAAGLSAITIENQSGDLNAWLDPAAGNDPRGSILRVYEVTTLDLNGSSTLIFEGLVEEVSQGADKDGIRTVQVTASSVASDAARTMIPPPITTSTFGIPQAEIPPEGLGRVVPVVIGGTREHFPAAAIKNDQTDRQFDWAVGYDAADAFVRTRINTLYSVSDDNLLRIVTPAAYEERHDLYSGVVVARFSDGRYIQSQLYADAEATEFDTANSAVTRHWPFRRSLTDEKKGAELLPSSAVGVWLFGGNTNDSSGNGHNLSALAGSESPLVYVDEGIIVSSALHSQLFPAVGGEFEAGSTTSIFDVGLTQSFRIEANVSRETRDVLNALDGPIAAKWGNGSAIGYELGLSGGTPYFWVQGATGAESLRIDGLYRLDSDSRFHAIRLEFDRTTDLMTLTVDGVYQASKSIAVVGSLANTGTKLYVMKNRGGQKFAGKIGRLAWYNAATSDDYDFVAGQSGNSLSAFSQATGYVREGDSSDLYATATEDLGVLAWFKRTNNPGATEVLVGKFTGGAGWKLELGTDGKLTVTASDGTNNRVLTSTLDLCDGKYHCAWLQIVRGGNVELYVDGLPDGTTTEGALGTLSSAAALELRLIGQFDELMIRKGATTALTAAQIRAHYFTARGNPARWARRLIENTTYGLSGAADATSFNDAEEELRDRGIYFGGALTQERVSLEVLAMMQVYGLTIARGTGTWTAGFGWQAVAGTPWAFGWLDGGKSNIEEAANLRRAPLSEIPKSVSIRYKRTFMPDKPTQTYLHRTFARAVATTVGRELLIIEMPLVRTWEVADRLGAYAALWLAKDRRLHIRASTEHRAAVPRDRATVTTAALGLTSATEWVIEQDERVSGHAIEYELREAPADPTAYAAGTAIPDLFPEELPDYRWTTPPAPEQIVILGQASITIATRVGFRMVVPTGDVAEALIVGLRVYWRYEDPATLFPAGAETVDFAAAAGQTVDWYALFHPGRTVEIAFVSVSRLGATSPPGLWQDGSTVHSFVVAADSGLTTGGLYGLEQRVTSLETGLSTYRPRKLATNTALPDEPDLTGGNEVFILVQGGIRWRVASAPGPNEFTLSGGTNQTITYGQAIGTATAIAWYKSA